MHAVLRYDANTQPTYFAIAAVLQLPLLVGVVIGHFHFALHHLIIVIAVSFVIDILNLLNFTLLDCIGNRSLADLMCWNPLDA